MDENCPGRHEGGREILVEPELPWMVEPVTERGGREVLVGRPLLPAMVLLGRGRDTVPPDPLPL